VAIAWISPMSDDNPCIFQLPATSFFNAMCTPVAMAVAVPLDARQPAS
jgi:hypothetical protein